MNNKKVPDYMILINGSNRLPDGFEQTVEIIPVENAVGENMKLRKRPMRLFGVCARIF